ncbi:MAG TPA: cytochrome c3 family protein [Blastocatellia bacterium]|nr:cytochrome c3 family protein [Blastocatellia bacterium]
MRGKLRFGAINSRTAKLCILSAFLGAQFLGERFLGAEASSPAALRSTARCGSRQAGTPPLPGTALPVDDNCVKCHAQSTGRAAEVVGIHQSSAHGRIGVGCDDCHGGDPAQTEKAKAHSTNFTAKPDRSATLASCGACHESQLGQFKTGKHFPEKQGAPRIDCAECHGAHSVGNPPETFSLGQFCAGCHGLEYLPPLPQEFQDLLNLSEDLRDEFNRSAAKGRKPSDDAIKQRKEIRRLTAEIIHPTDLRGGLTRIPQILSQGEKLKQQIR